MARPRAADDFPAIRARMKELRRERAGLPAEETRWTGGPRPYFGEAPPVPQAPSPGLNPFIRKAIMRVRTA